jgi:hypothetical protein
MRDEDKTREQLIRELVELREQLAQAKGKPPETEGISVEGTSEPSGVDYGAMEPWLPVETKLVVFSVVAGVVTLIVLATLVHMFLLGGH